MDNLFVIFKVKNYQDHAYILKLRVSRVDKGLQLKEILGFGSQH